MTLREFLDRVLNGTQTVRSRGELMLLRRVADINQLEKLDEIEQAFRKKENSIAIRSPAREIAERVLRDPVNASIEDLQEVLKRSRDLRLTSGQVDAVRATLSRIAAEQYRGESKPSELRRLGWIETPVGPLDPITMRSFERLRIAGLAKIEACTEHAKRNCQCYRDVRETLWQLHQNFSDAMPEGWLAAQIIRELADHALFNSAQS